MAYNQKPGRSPLEKTGRDIPLNMKSPAYMTDGPGDKKEGKPVSDKPASDKKAGVGEIPGLKEIQERFKNKYEVKPLKGKKNEYSLIDESGNSVSYKPGRKVKDNSITVKKALQEEFNKK